MRESCRTRAVLCRRRMICQTCQQDREFYPSDVARNQWSRCKECRKAAWRLAYQQDPSKFNKPYKKRAETVSKYRAARRRRSEEFRQREIASNRRQALKRYGLSEDQYAQLLQDQHGVCAICGKPETSVRMGRTRALAVDHDHRAGDVRGLLCRRCNTGLGLFFDDPATLRRAALYLEKWLATPESRDS